MRTSGLWYLVFEPQALCQACTSWESALWFSTHFPPSPIHQRSRDVFSGKTAPMRLWFRSRRKMCKHKQDIRSTSQVPGTSTSFPFHAHRTVASSSEWYLDRSLQVAVLEELEDLREKTSDACGSFNKKPAYLQRSQAVGKEVLIIRSRVLQRSLHAFTISS